MRTRLDGAGKRVNPAPREQLQVMHKCDYASNARNGQVGKTAPRTTHPARHPPFRPPITPGPSSGRTPPDSVRRRSSSPPGAGAAKFMIDCCGGRLRSNLAEMSEKRSRSAIWVIQRHSPPHPGKKHSLPGRPAGKESLEAAAGRRSGDSMAPPTPTGHVQAKRSLTVQKGNSVWLRIYPYESHQRVVLPCGCPVSARLVHASSVWSRARSCLTGSGPGRRAPHRIKRD